MLGQVQLLRRPLTRRQYARRAVEINQHQWNAADLAAS
jgi:hypothetical protein